MARAAPVHPTFETTTRPGLITRAELAARIELALWANSILRANLAARIELTLWAKVALHSWPSLEVLRPIVPLWAIKAPAVRLHTATEGHKQR
jgi:hypothetical protein